MVKARIDYYRDVVEELNMVRRIHDQPDLYGGRSPRARMDYYKDVVNDLEAVRSTHKQKWANRATSLKNVLGYIGKIPAKIGSSIVSIGKCAGEVLEATAGAVSVVYGGARTLATDAYNIGRKIDTEIIKPARQERRNITDNATRYEELDSDAVFKEKPYERDPSKGKFSNFIASWNHYSFKEPGRRQAQERRNAQAYQKLEAVVNSNPNVFKTPKQAYAGIKEQVEHVETRAQKASELLKIVVDAEKALSQMHTLRARGGTGETKRQAYNNLVTRAKEIIANGVGQGYFDITNPIIAGLTNKLSYDNSYVPRDSTATQVVATPVVATPVVNPTSVNPIISPQTNILGQVVSQAAAQAVSAANTPNTTATKPTNQAIKTPANTTYAPKNKKLGLPANLRNKPHNQWNETDHFDAFAYQIDQRTDLTGINAQWAYHWKVNKDAIKDGTFSPDFLKKSKRVYQQNYQRVITKNSPKP